MTYEERVTAMAKSLFAAATGYAPYKEVVENFYVRFAAKEAISRQAEAIRWALQPYRTNGFITDLLLKHGYIDPKTEDDAK